MKHVLQHLRATENNWNELYALITPSKIDFSEEAILGNSVLILLYPLAVRNKSGAQGIRTQRQRKLLVQLHNRMS